VFTRRSAGASSKPRPPCRSCRRDCRGLLERRPDIRRVEALLAASDLRIQQARTDYFPSLS